MALCGYVMLLKDPHPTALDAKGGWLGAGESFTSSDCFSHLPFYFSSFCDAFLYMAPFSHYWFWSNYPFPLPVCLGPCSGTLLTVQFPQLPLCLIPRAPLLHRLLAFSHPLFLPPWTLPVPMTEKLPISPPHPNIPGFLGTEMAGLQILTLHIY